MQSVYNMIIQPRMTKTLNFWVKYEITRTPLLVFFSYV